MVEVAASRKSHLFTVAHLGAFLIVLATIAALLGASLGNFDHPVRGDEAFYLRYMHAIADRGFGCFPALFDEWNADSSSWIFPPPSRVGFIVACGLWAKVFGASLAALTGLSFASHLAWISVNWFFARRRFGDAFALALAALTGFSPLLLGLSRLALTDSFTTLCLTIVVWTFLELVEQPRSRTWTIAFAASFAWVILVKELTVLVAVPLALFVIVERFARKTPLPLVRFALVLAIPAALAPVIFVIAAGGVEKLVETMRIVLASPATNPYAVQFCAGPWYRYLIDYLCTSPFTTLLALFAFGMLIARWRAGVYERRTAYFAILAAGLLAEHALFIKNIRYLAVLEVPLRVLALTLILELVGNARHAKWIVAILVVCLCAIDWASFVRIWEVGHGYDPISLFLLRVREIVPTPR